MASGTSKNKLGSQKQAEQLIVDLAGLETFLDQVESPRASTKRNALDQAQELYFEACQAPTAKGRIALAKKAIAISPLCADAFTLLAGHEKKASVQQLELYRTALDAGRKAIGKSFKEFAGEFWLWLETRPFMRAKYGLAVCLWQRGERAESLTHLSELLELNPNDNQGVRSTLAAYLLEERRHDELSALLKTFEDDSSADLAFSRSLLAFRLHGAGAKSRKALSAAIEQNKHVREYLSGREKLPRTLPGYYSWGDKNEAILYAAHFKKGWDETPGAIEWLCAFSSAEPEPSSRKKAAAAA